MSQGIYNQGQSYGSTPSAPPPYGPPAGAYGPPPGGYGPPQPGGYGPPPAGAYQPPAGAYQPQYQQPQVVYIDGGKSQAERDREDAEDCCLIAACFALLCCCLANN